MMSAVARSGDWQSVPGGWGAWGKRLLQAADAGGSAAGGGLVQKVCHSVHLQVRPDSVCHSVAMGAAEKAPFKSDAS